MNGGILTFKDTATTKYIVWLNKMGLGETMYIMINSWSEPDILNKATVLYFPKKHSVWWKV